MLTSLTLQYDVTSTTIGFVVGDHEEVKPGDMIPLYIPKLMPNVPKYDKPTESIVLTKPSSMMLKNNIATRCVYKTNIKDLKYILAKAEANSNYEGGLKHDQKVEVTFKNDSLVDIYFNTNFENEVNEDVQSTDTR